MSEPTPPPRRPSGCAVLLGCLGALLAAVAVVVYAVSTWATRHPWIVIAAAAIVAGGGTLGRWLAAREGRGRGPEGG